MELVSLSSIKNENNIDGTKEYSRSNDDHDTIPEKKNPHMFQTLRQRKDFLLILSYVPVVICFIAFGFSAIFRFIRTTEETTETETVTATVSSSSSSSFSYKNPTMKCKRYGWYNSSSAKVSCDHKALDIHAISALAWLFIYAIQVVLLTFRKGKWHRYFGYLGAIGAFANAGGMFWYTIDNIVNPMKNTNRPKDFTPFMIFVGAEIAVCIWLSFHALFWKAKKRDIDQHMIWIFRAFMISFSTPLMRFYPLVVRLMFGWECFEAHKHKFVMESMFVAAAVCTSLQVLAQRYTQRKFFDMFLIVQFAFFFVATAKEITYAWGHGSFIVGMVQCAASNN